MIENQLIDSAKDRAAITLEELDHQLSEQTNRAMYVLAIVAAISLPLSLLTGLLGINVGGIPGANNPWAFIIVTILLLAIAAVLVWLFKHIRWLLILHAPPGSGKLIKLQFKITLKLIDMAKEIKPVDSSGADKTLVALFLKMSPEERLQANDNAVRTILELRNAYQQQKREKSRPERDT